MPPLNTILKCMPKMIEDRMLPSLPSTPLVVPKGVLLPIKMPRANVDMRGPERIHNQLIYQQYGIMALAGGALTGAHIDVIRLRINKYTDFERFFAVWRIDAPWKARSKRSQGKKAGGGKGKVHHYETPIKSGRVIVEMGGIGQFNEIEHILGTVCGKLPLYAIPISQEIMDNLKREKQQIDERNYNPFDYRFILRNDFSGSQRKLPPIDRLWPREFTIQS